MPMIGNCSPEDGIGLVCTGLALTAGSYCGLPCANTWNGVVASAAAEAPASCRKRWRVKVKSLASVMATPHQPASFSQSASMR